MSLLSDFIDEMLRRRREEEPSEAILSHREPDVHAFAEVSTALAALNLERLGIDSDERASGFARSAAALVRSADSQTSRRGAMTGRPSVRRLVTAAASVVLVVGALTGVAFASDGAGPGNLLYGMDRALEQIGFRDGGLEERFSEASALASQGATTEALDHLADAVRSDSVEAADALNAAAENLRQLGSDGSSSPSVKDEVADMLEWIANSDAEGRDFGQGVAARAREIGRPSADAGPGNSDQNQPGSGGDSDNQPANGGDGDNEPADKAKDDKAKDDKADDDKAKDDEPGNSGKSDNSDNKGKVQGKQGKGAGPPGEEPPGQQGR